MLSDLLEVIVEIVSAVFHVNSPKVLDELFFEEVVALMFVIFEVDHEVVLLEQTGELTHPTLELSRQLTPTSHLCRLYYHVECELGVLHRE